MYTHICVYIYIYIVNDVYINIYIFILIICFFLLTLDVWRLCVLFFRESGIFLLQTSGFFSGYVARLGVGPTKNWSFGQSFPAISSFSFQNPGWVVLWNSHLGCLFLVQQIQTIQAFDHWLELTGNIYEKTLHFSISFTSTWGGNPGSLGISTFCWELNPQSGHHEVFSPSTPSSNDIFFLGVR